MQIFASPVASERAKTSVVKRSSSLVFNLEQTSKIVKKKENDQSLYNNKIYQI